MLYLWLFAVLSEVRLLVLWLLISLLIRFGYLTLWCLWPNMAILRLCDSVQWIRAGLAKLALLRTRTWSPCGVAVVL